MGISKQQLAESASLAADYRRLGYGPGTPTAGRREAAQEMYRLGATLTDIARVFEVSTEAVRHWTCGRRSMYLTDDERDLVLKYREHMRRYQS